MTEVDKLIRNLDARIAAKLDGTAAAIDAMTIVTAREIFVDLIGRQYHQINWEIDSGVENLHKLAEQSIEAATVFAVTAFAEEEDEQDEADKRA